MTTTTDRLNGISGGLALKAPCRAATTAAITLSGEQTIDAIACVAGDRVLVKNQASAVDNGIYEVSTGTWTRTLDFDGSYDAVQGTQVIINAGTVSSGLSYRLSTANPFVIGTDSINFSAVSLSSAADTAASAASAAAALASQIAAAASAVTAAANATLAAALFTDTSVTSNSIATGAKTFTVSSGKNFVAGQFILAVDSANPVNYMWGQVTSYSGTSLVIDSIAIGGSGTKTSWNISVSGSRGASGGGTGDMLIATYDAAGISAQVAGLTATQTFTNKSLSDSTTFFIDNVDGTKKLQFQCSTIGAGVTRTATWPNKDGTVAMTSDISAVTTPLVADSQFTGATAGSGGVAFSNNLSKSRSSTGVYAMSFGVAQADTNYHAVATGVSGLADKGLAFEISAKTTSGFTLTTITSYSNAVQDPTTVNVCVFRYT